MSIDDIPDAADFMPGGEEPGAATRDMFDTCYIEPAVKLTWRRNNDIDTITAMKPTGQIHSQSSRAAGSQTWTVVENLHHGITERRVLDTAPCEPVSCPLCDRVQEREVSVSADSDTTKPAHRPWRLYLWSELGPGAGRR